jgi:hypothetical protein
LRQYVHRQSAGDRQNENCETRYESIFHDYL